MKQITFAVVILSLVIAFVQPVQAATFYVGPTREWAELSRINWNMVHAGDTILVDGGTYHTTLTPGVSGTANDPITIRANEHVVIDGQGSRRVGISLSRPYIVVDGVSRYGFEVTGHTWAGIEITGGGDNVTVQYAYVHHNPPNPNGGDIFGFRTSGADGLIIRNCEINDNGQDAIQSILGGNNVLLDGNYIHSHHYNHPDALQMQGGVGLVIRRNVITSGFMQGIFLGENSNRSAWNTDVEIYDNLLYDYDYGIKSKNAKTQNWEIHHNTLAFLGNDAIQWCCDSPGALAPMLVHDNIFYKTGGFYFNTGGGVTEFWDNCTYQSGYVSGNVTTSGTISGDPQFVDANNGDFALRPGSPCEGKGSNITSLAMLYTSEGEPPPTIAPPTATNTMMPPTATNTALSPTSTSTLPPEPDVLDGLSWAATDGDISGLFTSNGTYIYQLSQTLDPLLGGRAAYRLNIEITGEYTVNLMANAQDGGSNSIFINMDAEPDTSMIFDVPITSGFAERTVAWRGNGTPDVSQFTPKIFILSAGEHELIIRGRESNTQISVVTIAPVTAEPTDTPQPTDTATATATNTATIRPTSTGTPTLTLTPWPSLEDIARQAMWGALRIEWRNDGLYEYATVNGLGAPQAGRTIIERDGVKFEAQGFANGIVLCDTDGICVQEEW